MRRKFWKKYQGPTVWPEMEFDPPLEACPLCASRRILPFITDYRGIKISRCHACTLEFMNPQYSDKALARFYDQYSIEEEERISSNYTPLRTERKLCGLNLMAPLVKPDGKFLSIGCGDGLEMKLAQDMGFDVQGYEVDPVAAEAVQSSTGIRVFSGDIFEIDFQRNTYDCVYLDQVLEHPKNPSRYLHLVHDLLAGGGIAYIGVPNIGSLSNKIKTTRGRLGLRARSRIGKHYDTWQHLHYFQPSCFQRVLKRLFHLDPIKYAGDPFPKGIRLTRNLRSAFPFLESSMIVLAKKTPA